MLTSELTLDQIFDPIRVFVVECKLLGRFDYRSQCNKLMFSFSFTTILTVLADYSIFQWLKKNTIERLSFSISSHPDEAVSATEPNVWKEVQDAEADVKSTLSDLPSAFIHVCRQLIPLRLFRYDYLCARSSGQWEGPHD